MLTPIYSTCSDLFAPLGQCILSAALPCPRSRDMLDKASRAEEEPLAVVSQDIPWKKLIPALLSGDREGGGCCTPSIPLCVPLCVSWRCQTPSWCTPRCHQQFSAWRRGAPCPTLSKAVTTIPHSEGMRAVPAGPRRHHSSPGPGNSSEPRVPPGFFTLPA